MARPQRPITPMNTSFLSNRPANFVISGTVATPATVIIMSIADTVFSPKPILNFMKNTRSDENVILAIRYARLEPIMILMGLSFRIFQYSLKIEGRVFIMDSFFFFCGLTKFLSSSCFMDKAQARRAAAPHTPTINPTICHACRSVLPMFMQ